MSKKHLMRAIGVIVVIVVIFVVARDARAPEETPAPLPPDVVNIPVIDPQSIGKVVKDPGTGKEFMSNQLIVEFNSGVTEETSLAVITRLGGKMQQRFTAVPLFLVEVEDDGDGAGARRAVSTFRSDPTVKSAELNFLTTAEETDPL